jgi:hypothetical protein
MNQLKSYYAKVWMDAVSGGDVLTGDKAAGYITDFKTADTDQDGKISQAEFKKACEKGLIRPEHAESAKMGKDVGTHPGGAGEAPPVESGRSRDNSQHGGRTSNGYQRLRLCPSQGRPRTSP